MGKGRSDKQGHIRSRQTWKLIFLSNGEISFPDIIRQSQKKVKAGQEVRIIDIPSDTGVYGIFEELHQFRDAKDALAFARFLADQVEHYYGTAGREFIKKITADINAAKKRLQLLIAKFVEEQQPTCADGQVIRVLYRFAVIAAAGTLASEYGITGWPPDDVFWSVSNCFYSWLKNRGGTSALEEKSALHQARYFFERYGQSRFATFDVNPSEKIPNMLGYKKMIEDSTHFFLFPQCYQTELCEGYHPEVMAKILIAKGWLIPDSEGKSTRSESLPCSKTNTRCYRFDSERIFSDEI